MLDLAKSTIAALKDIDLVVSVGSVDGILTSAALLRIIGKDVEIVFCQAFTVGKLPVQDWKERKVALVDLAVNNRDKEMTRAFIGALQDNRNKLVAVIDEHNREDWEGILGSFDGLVIEPQSQGQEGAPGSSGELLRRELEKKGSKVDSYTIQLLRDADAGDHGNFDTLFGLIANMAVKSDIRDDSRRVYLAKHLAVSTQPDEKIAGWMIEYDGILANHDQIVADKENLGNGIHRVVATGFRVDMTTLMFRLYDEDAKVVALEGEAYIKVEGGKRPVLALGTKDKSLDLMSLIEKAGLTPLGGYAQKVNVDLKDEEAAIAAIRPALG